MRHRNREVGTETGQQRENEAKAERSSLRRADRTGLKVRPDLPIRGSGADMESTVRGYNSYPGSGWVSYGRLIINYHNNRVGTIFFAGQLIWSRE